MITHLIDSDGYHAYSGHEQNPKVARLEQEGCVRVPTALPDTDIRQKWVSDAWQNDPVVPDYAELRRGAYANAGDQLDTIWKWMEAEGLVPDTSESRDLNTAAGMLGEVKAVKAAHPKL